MLVSLVHLVYLVCFVYLVDLVHLVDPVSLVQPNKRDRPAGFASRLTPYPRPLTFHASRFLFSILLCATELWPYQAPLEGTWRS
jgi:hypothetical protein